MLKIENLKIASDKSMLVVLLLQSEPPLANCFALKNGLNSLDSG